MIDIDYNALEAQALKIRCHRLGGFRVFVKHFWPVVDPRPLIWNWHMDVLCDLIEALLKGLINRLLINIPPGMAKSVICSVLAPAYKWSIDPGWACIFGSHDENLALRDAVKARDLIKHEEYQRVFKPAWAFNPAQDTKHLYKTTVGGMRYSTSVGGAITGFRGSAVVVDDPLDANKTPSEAKLREHIEWFGNLSSRIDDMENSQWLVIMQRLCEGDLSEILIERGDWVVLRLPAEYDPEEQCIVYDHDGNELWRDPRTELGEPLFPGLQPPSTLRRLRVYLGDFRFETQYNQHPRTPGGGVIKHDQANWHTHPGILIRKRCIDVVMSVDLTFMKSDAGQEKANSRRSFNDLSVWGTDSRNFYLIDNDFGRWQWDECKERMRDMVKRWKIWKVLVEEATVSGIVVSEMSDVFNEIIEIPPIGSKEARFSVAARYWRMNRVWLPDVEWAHAYFKKIEKFPNTIHKDAADTMSQAILHFTAGGDFDMDEWESDYSTKIETETFNPASTILAQGY